MIEGVLEDITPSEQEAKKLRETAKFIKKRIKELGRELDTDVEPRLVGSSGRGTWISGDRDIDVFILFSKDLDREELKKKGLELARKTAEDADSFQEDYAEHPYITARFGEFLVDLVPAYNISGAQEIASAVDRTPLHHQYVSKKLNDELKNCTRLLKKFMKSIGVYGAELRVKGFSGYLTELLTIYYGEKNQSAVESFKSILEAASRWRKGETIDIEGYGVKEEFETPLVVIDPVDSSRNVAAALELEQWAKFVAASNQFLRKPKKTYFTEKQREGFDKTNLIDEIERRNTNFVGIEFDEPGLVDDTLYPQLYKTQNWVGKLLKREGFRVVRSSVFSDGEKALVLFETWNDLPRVEKHIGPPVTSREHSLNFVEKYVNEDVFAGPYIEEDRWVVERKREHTQAKRFIEEKITNLEQAGTGKNLKRVNKKVLTGANLLKDRYVDFIGEFLSKKVSWL